MEKRQQHASWLQHRPKAPHHRTDQALFQIVWKIPTEHYIKMSRRVDEVVSKKFPAVENDLAFFVFGYEGWVGGGDQQVFAIDPVCALGKEANVCGRRRTQIEDAQGSFAVPKPGKLAEPAGAARELLGSFVFRSE